MKIFIAEDEENILNALKLNLELDGFDVLCESNGQQALKKIKQHVFDLIVLDVMLPEMDGYTICENLRALGIQTPVLFLTAKNDAGSRIKGLKLGADDYLGKPFDLEEFLLRVRILLRRNSIGEDQSALKIFEFDERKIDFEKFKISNASGKEETISKKENELLRLLIMNRNKVVSREDIIEKIWPAEESPNPRTIDNFILNFRKFFEENPKEPKYFQSIRGVGYSFQTGIKY